VTLSARERLDLNISTTFVEIALGMLSTWSKEGEAVLQKARGSYAPYRIRNLTGSAIYIWSDSDGSQDVKEAGAVQIENGGSTDWRFDDWRTMREVSLSD
jgi:vacuolar protein sorting-associated protein 13A/C